MLHLPYPRRRNRALFFPPGLLALAGLLWLGCVVVPKAPPKIYALWSPTAYNYLDTVSYGATYYNTSTAFDRFFHQVSERNPTRIYLSSTDEWMHYFISRELDFVLPDNSYPETNTLRGIRVSFFPGTSQKQLYDLLSLLQRRPNTIYSVQVHQRLASVWIYREPIPGGIECVGMTPIMMPDTPPLNFLQQTEQIARVFTQLNWRNTWLMLLLLTGLSGWKLRRQWRAAA